MRYKCWEIMVPKFQKARFRENEKYLYLYLDENAAPFS